MILRASSLCRSMITRLTARAKRLPILNGLLPRLGRSGNSTIFPGSGVYWEARYAKGGTSGAGSYGSSAHFKAAVLNTFVEKNGVTTVTEFGCGDGNQLSLMRYPEYSGLDVSETILIKCRERFRGDTTKRFFVYHPKEFQALLPDVRADLTLSLDVIYHLVEDEVFESYMRDLFRAAKRYVVVYSTDIDANPRNQSLHVHHRSFTPWIAAQMGEWQMVNRVENPLPPDEFGGAELRPDFYFFVRK